jgi:hypothetical protein
MADLATLVVRLVGDATGYQGMLKGAETDAHRFATRATSGLAAIGGGIVTAVAGAAVIGAGAIGLLGAASVREAMRSQDVMAQFQAVLKSTGSWANYSSGEIVGMAKSLGMLTKFDDEAILSGQSLLLTFTSIGEDVFPDATEVMLDMSQALGQDLQSSAIQLGKALQDPILGVTALRRVGVNFSDSQQDVIKNLVETGRLEEAQVLILKELQTEFGGSAKAAGQTFAGQLAILQNQLGNAKETIGGAFLPVLTTLATTLNQYLARPETIAFLQEMAKSIADFATRVVSQIPPAVEWIRRAFGWLQENQGVIVAALAVIGAAILAWVYTVVIPAAVAAIAAIWPVVLVLAIVAAAAYLIYEAWTKNWGGIQEKTAAVVAWLKQAFQDVMAFIMAIWNNPALQLIIQTVLQNIRLLVAAFQAAFSGDWTRFGELLRMGWDNAWRMITTILRYAWENIRRIVSDLVRNVVQFIATTDWGQVGRNIIAGIANGMMAVLSWIRNAAISAAQAALAAAKGFLGIHSPSEAAEMQIGVPFGQGVGVGMQRSIGALAGNMPGMFGATLQPALATVSSGMRGGGGERRPISVEIHNPTFFGTDLYEVARALEPAFDLLARRAGLK